MSTAKKSFHRTRLLPFLLHLTRTGPRFLNYESLGFAPRLEISTRACLGHAPASLISNSSPARNLSAVYEPAHLSLGKVSLHRTRNPRSIAPRGCLTQEHKRARNETKNADEYTTPSKEQQNRQALSRNTYTVPPSQDALILERFRGKIKNLRKKQRRERKKKNKSAGRATGSIQSNDKLGADEVEEARLNPVNKHGTRTVDESRSSYRSYTRSLPSSPLLLLNFLFF